MLKVPVLPHREASGKVKMRYTPIGECTLLSQASVINYRVACVPAGSDAVLLLAKARRIQHPKANF